MFSTLGLLGILLGAAPPPARGQDTRPPAAEAAGETAAEAAPAPEAATPADGDPSLDDTPPSEANPLQVVAWSLRNQYIRLSDDAWSDAVVFRSDRVLVRPPAPVGGKVGLLTRFDVPLVGIDAGDQHAVGLGDLYLQAIHVPQLSRRFALGLGSGLTLDTATDDRLGGGKWRIEPLVVPVVFFPRAHATLLVLVKRQLSFAGSDSRPDVDVTQVTPVLLKRTGRRFAVFLDSEALIDHNRDDQTQFRSGVELAWYRGGGLAVFVKPEISWGGHRTSDWRLRVTFTRFRRR